MMPEHRSRLRKRPPSIGGGNGDGIVAIRLRPVTEIGMAQQLRRIRRVAWFNGEAVPEGQVMIPFRDRSWKYSNSAFDMTRTFEGEPFRLKEHIDRLHPLAALPADRSRHRPQGDRGASEEVVARNEVSGPAVGDWWDSPFRQQRRVDAVGATRAADRAGPNIVIEVLPLPLEARAPNVPRRRRST